MSDKAKRITGGGCLLAFAILVAAILFPVFQKVRENHRNYCQADLKQLGLAIVQYTQDNDEEMPNIASQNGLITWRTAVYPYAKSRGVYLCVDPDTPRSKEVTGSDGFSQDFAANYTGNYGQTQPDRGEGAFAGPASKPLGPADFDSPASLITLVEAENNDRPEFNIDSAGLFGPSANKLWAGHHGGGNYLFMDGHVKWLPPLKTYATDLYGKVTTDLWYRNANKPLSANGIAVLKAAQARFGVQ